MKKITRQIIGLLFILTFVHSFVSKVYASENLIVYRDFENIKSIMYSGWTMLKDQTQCISEARIKSGTNGQSVEVLLDSKLDKKDVILLHFVAKAGESCAKIQVRVNYNKYIGTFSLPVDETEFILPISNLSFISRVSISLISDPQTIEIGNMEIINCGQSDISRVSTGQFLVNASKIAIDEYSGKGFAATDILTDSKYLYAVNSGYLMIYSLENPNSPKLISTLYGLGNTRKMALNEEKNLLAISSRENGVFLVDISNKQSPKIISSMRSMGLATGISLSDNYCFVCCRRQGVEIYDISNPYSPVYCGRAYDDGEEYYDCFVEGNMLYVTSWAEKEVTIYNLENINNPELLNCFQIGGCGAGCFVRDSILYVATGYNAMGASARFTNHAYGMGNGFDIYDVTDAKKPVWLSSSKIDGRYAYSGFDHWKVNVSGDVAYVTNVYNGVFVYDISDLKNPVRKVNYYINISKGSANYVSFDTGNYLFPYDVNSHGQAIASAVAVIDGYVYISSTNGVKYSEKKQYSDNGLYVIPSDTAVYEKNTVSEDDGIYTGETENIFSGSIKYNLTSALEGYDVWAVHEADGLFYAATGRDGIIKFTDDGVIVNKYDTTNAAMDVIRRGDYFYISEGSNGLGVYSLTDDKLVRVGSCNTDYPYTYFSYIDGLENDNILVVQTAWARYALIDISNPISPNIIKNVTTGTMYGDSLCGGTIEGIGFIGIFHRKEVEFYQKDGAGSLVLTHHYANNSYSETGGMAVSRDGIIITNITGYTYLNLIESNENHIEQSNVVISGIDSSCMPVVQEDTLVMTNSTTGVVYIIDISDIDNPVIMDQFNVGGTPGTAFIMDNQIVIPMGHGGVVICSEKVIQEDCSQGHNWFYYNATTKQLHCNYCNTTESAEKILYTGWAYDRVTGKQMYLRYGKCVRGYLELEDNKYYFDSEGYAYTGFFSYGGEIYYALDGVSQKGLVLVNDKYYYFDLSGAMQEGTVYVTVADSNGLLNADKTMSFSKTVEFRKESGKIYCYVEGIKTYAGLIEVDGSLYYVNNNSNVVTGHYYVSRTNNLVTKGYYDFDESGRMIK